MHRIVRLFVALAALGLVAGTMGSATVAATHDPAPRHYVVAEGQVGTFERHCSLDTAAGVAVNAVCFPVGEDHEEVHVEIEDAANEIRGVPTWGWIQFLDEDRDPVDDGWLFCGAASGSIPADAAEVEVAVEPHIWGVYEILFGTLPCAEHSGTAGSITAAFS